MALTDDERRRLDNDRSRRQGGSARRNGAAGASIPRVRPGDPDRSSELSQRERLGMDPRRASLRRLRARAPGGLSKEHAAISADEHSATREQEARAGQLVVWAGG